MEDHKRFIAKLPKAELHLHIEGTFEPELMFKIAERNRCRLKHSSIERLRQAYDFNNLQEFLDIYYEGANVLLKEQDFYDLTMAYLQQAAEERILHTEIFFDPQTHTSRGVSFSEVIGGIHSAICDARRQMNISASLIMCFLRHLDAASAMRTLDEALPHRDKIIAVGLDSTELGNPPEKFTDVFDKARELSFLCVAHAGEEGPASYVWGALEYLKVHRIDHGNHSLHDDELLSVLAEKQIPLTLCPLSNLKLKVIGKMEDHPLKKLMQKGLLVTVNSDDPAYFGGYINENYFALAQALRLTKEEIVQIAKNSFRATFISEDKKLEYLKAVDDYATQFV